MGRKRTKEEIERRESDLDNENSALRVVLSAILAGETPIVVEVEPGSEPGQGSGIEIGERFSLYRPLIASGGAVLIEQFDRSTGKVYARDAILHCRMPNYSGDHYRRDALRKITQAMIAANKAA